jgi:protein SCO1/2
MKISNPFACCLLMICVYGQAMGNTVDLPFYLDTGLVPEWAEQLDGRDKHSVADFQLTNQQGKLITGDELSGKVRIVNFFFSTCPGVCPTTMQNLKKVQQHINTNQAVMLSFSITPNIDTPERLAEYATAQKIDLSRWQLLTGEADQITRLAKDSFFAVLERNVDQNAFVHTEKAFLVDRDGFIRGVYNATSPADVMRLTEDLQQLSTSDKLN